MNRTLVTLAVFLLVAVATPTVVRAAEPSPGVWCTVFGWAVKPFGFCALAQPRQVVIESTATVDPAPVPPPELPISTVSGTVAQVLPQSVTNEYITVQQNGVSEAQLEQRIAELLTYINNRPLPITPTANTFYADNAQKVATREYVYKSTDKSAEQLSKAVGSLKIDAEFTSPTLTDALLAGVTYVSGRLGIGTTSPSDVLSVSGAMYLGSTNPSNPTNRLYNSGGDLYWGSTLVTGSSTANWSTLAGDVFRLTGNVGIGTSSLSDTLTVAGTVSAGTTTARIVDTGGAVCNVEAYGAVGDNATLNDAAIAAAIAACPEGGTVFFPMGEFRISSPIILDKPVTLRGSYAPRWSYSSTPRSSIRADFGSFAGVAIIHVRDKSISGEANHNNGGRLENLSIDGGSASADVDGVYFEGLVRDWKLTDVDISQVTGNGFEAAVGTGSGNPRGFTIRGLSIYSADGHGFRATALNDSYVDDLLAVGNALRGIYLSSMGETKFNSARAVFNGLTGLYIDGSTNNGGLTFTDFSTDRNDRHGVRISSTGTSTVVFNGLLTRRDGPNLSGGSETPYAGVAIIGSTTAKVSPVFINGLAQVVGYDDSSNPPLAPLTGVRVTNATYVKIDGQLWGVTDAYSDDGGNDNFIIEDDSVLKTGTAGMQELYTNDRKWIATTTGLFYGSGKVSIGSTTGSRLLNIIAPSQAGARFQDTTNNVIFDMRAEDYQGFFGTFSNHQLRFQTNNLSRLTIDTNGKVGIGTTSPDQMLDVIGTIQASNLLGGAVNLTTDANGNIIRDPSDVRLKTNILDVNNALDKVLALRGVTYEWRDTERFGDQVEIGFIAQEVDEVVPEAVRKGGEYWALNTRNLLAVVVEGMKEMWETVTGNKRKIEALEERFNALEKELGVDSQVQKESEVESVEPNVDAIVEEVTTETASGTEAVSTDETEAAEETDEVPAEEVVDDESEPESELEPEPEPEVEQESEVVVSVAESDTVLQSDVSSPE